MTRRGRPPRLITAWGESKTLDEWVRDRRCKAPSVMALRQRRYAHPDEPWEELMRAPSGAQIGHMVTAWGQTKSIRGWARDDRCSVSPQALARRFRIFPDLPPEEVISAPPDAHLDDDSAYGPPAKKRWAFGESKTVREWADDPRCPVSYWGLITRIREHPDAPFETALTASTAEWRAYTRYS